MASEPFDDSSSNHFLSRRATCTHRGCKNQARPRRKWCKSCASKGVQYLKAYRKRDSNRHAKEGQCKTPKCKAKAAPNKAKCLPCLEMCNKSNKSEYLKQKQKNRQRAAEGMCKTRTCKAQAAFNRSKCGKCLKEHSKRNLKSYHKRRAEKAAAKKAISEETPSSPSQITEGKVSEEPPKRRIKFPAGFVKVVAHQPAQPAETQQASDRYERKSEGSLKQNSPSGSPSDHSVDSALRHIENLFPPDE